MRVPLDGYQQVEDPRRRWPHVHSKVKRRAIRQCPELGDAVLPIWQVRRNHRKPPPPSLKAALIKVSTVSLKAYLGVGEVARDPLGWRLQTGGWTVLTMDCGGHVWMGVSFSCFFYLIPRSQRPLPYKYPTPL